MLDRDRLAPWGLGVFILGHVALLVAIMAAGRLALVLANAGEGDLAGRGQELWAMWRVGTLFDMRTSTILLSPLYALGLAACIHRAAARACSGFQTVWSPILYFVVILTTVVNFFYFRTFHNEIDISIFGLLNDGTVAVLTAALRDYPSVRVFLALATAVAFFAWATRRLWRVCSRWPPPTRPVVRVAPTLPGWAAFGPPTPPTASKVCIKWRPSRGTVFGTVLLTAFTALYIVGVRGTLRAQPLRQHNRMVSTLTLLNKAVPNAPITLFWAMQNYLDTPPYLPVDPKEGAGLAMAAIGRDGLTETTPINPWLEKNPPHVVALVMESFGSNMLTFDEPGRTDLLGSFRQHFGQGLVFRRFISEENFTMPVLARLFFFCPEESISRGRFKSKRLSGTPFEVYKRMGYETVFIYPGHGSWHDLRQYLSVHGVDRTFFLTDFIEKYKDTHPQIHSDVSARGLPDGYVFPLVAELLEKSKKPMFIAVLTLTNHLPDVPPPYYTDRYPLNPSPEILDKLTPQKRVKTDMVRSYQYAANCVGDFIAEVKAAPYGSRTVIGAFGDHRVINVRADYPKDLFLNRSVPFYLHVPKEVLANTAHRFDPDRVGSSKDIMPTLYSLSLSGARYHTVGGRNMLAPSDDPARAFGYNTRLYVDAEGATALGDDFSNTWHTFDADRRLDPTPRPIPFAKQRKIRAFEQLYRWQINRRVAGEKNRAE